MMNHTKQFCSLNLNFHYIISYILPRKTENIIEIFNPSAAQALSSVISQDTPVIDTVRPPPYWKYKPKIRP